MQVIKNMERRTIQFGREKRVLTKRKQNSKFLQFLFQNFDILTLFKRRVVTRLFWGRSNFYKNITHFVIISITLAVTITGTIYGVRNSTANAQNTLSAGETVTGQEDLLEQGGSIETVLATSSDNGGLNIINYTVQEGDSIETIAEEYNLNPDTIRSINADVGSIAFSDNLQVGWVLKIPSINGYIYEVKPGDTIDSIVTTAGVTNNEVNRFNIIEFNNLQPPYDLAGISTIFVPDGNRDLRPSGSVNIPTGVFIDPLSHSSCVGYNFTRGYLSYHNGVDLAKWDGCIISSMANGVVTYAGWRSQGQGYMVEIDHGGGIVTKYFHGNGEFYARTGQTVKQGDPIMYMGTTGFSTGVHLHFSLWKDGRSVNPRPYVPYKGAY